MLRVIGIDFGTSTTYMNVKRYQDDKPDGDQFSYMPVVFNYGESSGYVVTIARENADGSFDFGEKAAEALEGSTIHTEIKMRLESPNQEEREEARRITRAFFQYLYDTYLQQSANLGSGDDQEETVVSYPVKWQEETAQFMLEAAREAGFQNVRGMDEAQAAVSAVMCQNSGGKGLVYADKPGYLLLIDMGAGTTDLVVCRYRMGEKGLAMELVTSWPQGAGEPAFGGRELDRVLEGYVEDYLKECLNPALAPQAHIIAAAPGQAKMWKERNVSVTLAGDKVVNTCAYVGTYKSMGMLTGDFPAFGRREFEAFAGEKIREYARLLEGCLWETARRDGEFAAAGLDLVILTGGHSAWYFARGILDGTVAGWLDHPALERVRQNPNRVVNLPNPQTTVSLGLVYSRLPVEFTKQSDQEQPDHKDGETPGTDSRPEEAPGEEKTPEERDAQRRQEGEDAFRMGCRYLNGLEGVTRDWNEAAKWFRRAAELGNGDAMVQLGACYAVGRGVTRSEELAIEWYREAAHHGREDALEMIQELKEKQAARNKGLFAAGKGDKKDDPILRLDRSRCPHCGHPAQQGDKRCSICGCKLRKEPTLPYKVGFVSWYKGEVKLGIAKATGTLTIYEDRVEFKRHLGSTAAALTPYTFVYASVKANTQPKDIYWMKDIAGARQSSYTLGIPTLILTMRAGEVYTFATGFNTKSSREAIEDCVELIQTRISQ